MPQKPPSGPPLNIFATTQSNSSILIQWQPPDISQRNGAILGYTIRYKLVGLSDSYTQFRNVTDSSAQYCYLEGLPIAREFIISIAAYNAKGLGLYSSPIVERTAEGHPTAAPSDLRVTQDPGSSPVFVSFKPIDGSQVNGISQGYKVQFICFSSAPCSNHTRLIPREDGRSVLTLSVDDLTKYALYNVSAACYTAEGDGPYTSPIQILTNQGVPDAVGSLSIANNIGTSVTVQWTQPLHPNGIIDGYRISLWLANTTQQNQSFFAHSPALSQELTVLLSQTWYLVAVEAHTSPGYGPATKVEFLSGVPPVLPSPPSRLSLSNIQSRTVTLDFIPGDPGHTSISLWLVEYRLVAMTAQVSRASDWLLLMSVRDPQASSLTVTGLKPFRQYQLRLTAQNIVGRSAPSQPTIWFKTSFDLPELPPHRLISLETSVKKGVQLFWEPYSFEAWNGPPIGFLLLVSATSQPQHRINITNANAYSYIISSITPATAYHVSLAPLNSQGQGPSASVSFTSWDASPSAPPSGPIVVDNIMTSSARVSWAEVPGGDANGLILGYNVYYCPSASCETWQIASVLGNDTLSTNISSLVSFTSFSLKVAAFNKIGEGPSGPIVNFQTIQTVPSSPTRMGCTVLSATSALLYWSPPEHSGGPISHYLLHYQQLPVNTSTSSETISVSFNATTFTLTGLLNQYDYQLSLIAVRPSGQSDKRTILFNPRRSASLPPSCSQPSVLTGTIGPTSMALAWSQLASSTDSMTPYLRNFTVKVGQLALNNSISWTILDQLLVLPGQENRVVINNLQPYTFYAFQVAGNNDIGKSKWSGVSEMTQTLASVPVGAPKIINITTVTNFTAKIEWQPLPIWQWNGPRPGYKLFYRLYNHPNSRTMTVYSPPNSTQLLLDLTPIIASEDHSGVQLEAWVQAITSYGFGPQGAPYLTFVGLLEPRNTPTNFECSLPFPNQIDCTWDSLSEESQLSGYMLLYSSLGPVDQKQNTHITNYSLAVPTSNKERISLSNLSLYTRFSLTLSGFNLAGVGPPTHPLVTMETGEGIPGRVTRLRLSRITYQSMSLLWNPPDPANGIIVKYWIKYFYVVSIANMNETRSSETILSGSVTSFLDTTLLPFREYSVTLTAATVIGWGESTSLLVSTKPVVGGPPSPLLQMPQVTADSVRLIWRANRKKRDTEDKADNSTILAIFVEGRITGSSDWQLIAYVMPPISPYDIPFTSLRSDTSYQFRMTAVNSRGMGTPTDATPVIKIPNYSEAPFYRQWWFLVIIGLVTVILIILTISLLCFTGRKAKSKVQQKETPQVYAEHLTEAEMPFLSYNMATFGRTVSSMDAGSLFSDDLHRTSRSRESLVGPHGRLTGRRPPSRHTPTGAPTSRLQSGFSGPLEGMDLDDDEVESKHPFPSSSGKPGTDSDSYLDDDDEFASCSDDNNDDALTVRRYQPNAYNSTRSLTQMPIDESYGLPPQHMPILPYSRQLPNSLTSARTPDGYQFPLALPEDSKYNNNSAARSKTSKHHINATVHTSNGHTGNISQCQNSPVRRYQLAGHRSQPVTLPESQSSLISNSWNRMMKEPYGSNRSGAIGVTPLPEDMSHNRTTPRCPDISRPAQSNPLYEMDQLRITPARSRAPIQSQNSLDSISKV